MARKNADHVRTILFNRVPEVTFAFWVIKILSTPSGETAADYLNSTLGLGLTITSWIMTGLLVIALTAQFATKRYTSGVSTELPELSLQPIRPFTDLLLHDMGEGLADGRPEFEASGTEWRTPPLWGIGRIEDVNDHTYLLHDGRARGFAEAILWHGGEAEAARERFRTMPRADRDALIRFLESL